MFFENLTDLMVGCKSSFARRFQATIYSGQLFRRRLVQACSQPGINFKRDLRKLALRLFRPFFHAFENIFENLGCHGSNIANCSAP
jgi:hypothetical protein